MYKRINPLPADYSESVEMGTVYKCKKDIECKDGVFTKGSFVMLDVCSAEKGEIYVIDFVSMLKNRVLDYTYGTNVKIERDKADLLPNQLGDFFEEVKELSYKLDNYSKYAAWNAFITLMIIIIITILCVCFKLNIGIIVVTVLAAFIGLPVFCLAKRIDLCEELEYIIAEENNRDNVSL